MVDLEKSDVMKNLLTTLINISGRKTNKGHAIFAMESLIKKLENQYDFLKHVQINDTRYSEMDDAVSVMSDINSAESIEMGKAIQDIITTMNRSLGKNAGHFFIKEIRNTISDDHKTIIQEMGVDLGLLQLEHEVEELEKITMKKD